jgi:hypothetical protein
VTDTKRFRRHGANLKGCQATARAVHSDRQSCRRRVQGDAVGANRARDLRSERPTKKRAEAPPYTRRIGKRLKDKLDPPQLAADHSPSHLRQRKGALKKPAGVRVVVTAENAGVSQHKPIANRSNLGLREKP